MPSIWPQRRNPLEERILRRRRTPADALPGLGECNLLINDGEIDLLEISDFSPVLNLQGDTFFAIPPPKSVASMVELQVQNNPESISGLIRYDWHFKPDGTRVWTWRNGTTLPGSFRQYDVSPAWSITPGTWTLSAPELLIGGTLARTFEWSPDGTKLTMLRRWFSSFRRIDTWDQSATPFDVSSGLGPVIGSFTGLISGEFGMHWKPDGLILYVDRAAGEINAYALTVPFDINSITGIVQTFDSTIDAGARSMNMAWGSDGTVFYSITSGGLLCQWTASTPYDVSTLGSFVTGPNVNAVNTMAIPRGLLLRPSTGDLFVQRDQGSPQRMKVFG